MAQLHEDAQKYIPCLEPSWPCCKWPTYSRLGHRYLSFAMSAGSYKNPTEAGVNKLPSLLPLLAPGNRFKTRPSVRSQITLAKLFPPEAVTPHPSHARWRDFCGSRDLILRFCSREKKVAARTCTALVSCCPSLQETLLKPWDIGSMPCTATLTRRGIPGQGRSLPQGLG